MVAPKPSTEQAPDWDAIWRHEPVDPEAAAREARTPRFRAQETLVEERFGGFANVSAIEIGAGRGLNALLYAERGARVTLLDTSVLALEQAERLFRDRGLAVQMIEADVFDLPRMQLGAYDLTMSFGLCEHFLGERRRRVVCAHLELLRPGGLAFLGVPNRYAPVYRLWKGILSSRGRWPLGTEEPFSAGELAELARSCGGEPLPARYGSFAASLVDHGLNQVLYKLGGRGVRVPTARVPFADRLAYELLLPVARPA